MHFNNISFSVWIEGERSFQCHVNDLRRKDGWAEVYFEYEDDDEVLLKVSDTPDGDDEVNQ